MLLKAKELRLKTKEELKKILEESQNKLRDLYFGISLKQLKNVRDLRKVKKLIAKIKTILNLK